MRKSGLALMGTGVVLGGLWVILPLLEDLFRALLPPGPERVVAWLVRAQPSVQLVQVLDAGFGGRAALNAMGPGASLFFLTVTNLAQWLVAAVLLFGAQRAFRRP